MPWILNGNGLGFLDERSRERITTATSKELRFMTATGLVAYDGETHLYMGDRIVADWSDAPPPPPPQLMPPPGAAATLDIATIVTLDIATIVAIGSAVKNAVDNAVAPLRAEVQRLSSMLSAAIHGPAQPPPGSPEN